MASLKASDIEVLKESVRGTVIVKNETSESTYRTAIARWNDVFVKEAAIVVFVEDEGDVAECIKFVMSLGLDLAVCGGRHALKGTSSSDGLVIDLGNMNKVTVNRTSKEVTAEGGCRAGDLEKAAYEEGLAVVTGVVNDTGIALGAGLGWLSGQYGYMVDNILSARVVLANGSVVTTSESENPDLFWAIRGSGGGFGVVVEFTFRAYEQGPVFAGFLIFSPEKVEQCIDVASSLYETAIPASKGRLQLMLSYASPPPAYQPTPLFVVFYNGSESAARSLCAPIYDLGPIGDTTAVIPYPIMNTLFNEKTDMYKRHGLSAARLPLPLDKDALRNVWTSYSTTIPKFPDSWPSHVVVELRHLAPGLTKSNGDMAFAGRGHWTNILFHPQWDAPAYDVELREWATGLARQINEKSLNDIRKGQAISYANYASGDEKSAEIFGANYPRLRELKRKYDPHMLFNKWYLIMPAEL